MRRGYGRKTYEIVAWTYEADIHCLDCAEERFGPPLRISGSGRELEGIDSEGNQISPVFLDQLSEFSMDYDEFDGRATVNCGTCHEEIE